MAVFYARSTISGQCRLHSCECQPTFYQDTRNTVRVQGKLEPCLPGLGQIDEVETVTQNSGCELHGENLAGVILITGLSSKSIRRY